MHKWRQTALKLLWLITILVGITLGATSPAQANTGGYPYADYNGPGSNPAKYIWTNSNGHMWSEYKFAYRNCTDFVAWKLNAANGLAFVNNTPHGTYGNAENWASTAQANGYIVNMEPAVGAVAWWAANAHGMSGYGHVAWVSGVNGNTVTTEEYNNPGGGTWSTRSFTKEKVSGYIHFKDIGTPTGGPTPPPPNTNQRLVGDVNGDGMADAVVMFGATGNAKVALSNSTSFGYPGDWSMGHSINATSYHLGDVTGDGKADLVAYYSSSRRWYVSVSSGNGFWQEAEWGYDGPEAAGFTRAFIADVTGDGKADKVVWFATSGNWWVSASSGSGFWPYAGWIGGSGIGSNNQAVADFNGDGKADAATYFANSGNWYVALSNGSQFGYPGDWSGSHGLGTALRLVGDTTGDGKADIAYYSNNIHKWWVAASSGTGFWSLNEWSWDGPGYNTFDQEFIADADGDGKADKIIWFRSSGNWHVGRSSGSGFWPLGVWINGHGAGT